MERIIFHIDVNNAFLSWTAVHNIRVLGEKQDLREIPSAICGDVENRRGIILAKSTPAKNLGVKTGEPLFMAKEKCPMLVTAKPNKVVYSEYSKQFMQILLDYSPIVEKYSIDEAWVDMTGTQHLHGDYMTAAKSISKRIYNELGFTVNIGISSNKLLAKTAGDFEKPNKIHTLFEHELTEKFLPLPVRDLLYVGASTEKKLHSFGLKTIGDIAKCDVIFLQSRFGKQGVHMWELANGKDFSAVNPNRAENKSYGNSTTTKNNIVDTQGAKIVIQSLCTTVSKRMKKDDKVGECITVTMRSTDFKTYSHQMPMYCKTNDENKLYKYAVLAFEKGWKNEALRLIGVQVTKLSSNDDDMQLSLFDKVPSVREQKINSTVDNLRKKFGDDCIFKFKN